MKMKCLVILVAVCLAAITAQEFMPYPLTAMGPLSFADVATTKLSNRLTTGFILPPQKDAALNIMQQAQANFAACEDEFKKTLLYPRYKLCIAAYFRSAMVQVRNIEIMNRSSFFLPNAIPVENTNDEVLQEI